MYDVRQNETLSAKQLEKLAQGVIAVEECLDMHDVFIPAMETWINVNLEEIGLGLRTPPQYGILAAVKRLHMWNRPLDMLYDREGRKYELEQSAKEQAENPAGLVLELKPAGQPSQQVQQSVTQQSVTDQLPVQLLEGLHLEDKKSLNDTPPDEKLRDDFSAFYDYLVEVDAGRSLSLTYPTTSKSESTFELRQYGEANPEDIALFGEECAILLAEAPFSRVLDYSDITIGTKARNEVIKRVSALQGMLHPDPQQDDDTDAIAATYRELKKLDPEIAEQTRRECMDILSNDFSEIWKPFEEYGDE